MVDHPADRRLVDLGRQPDPRRRKATSGPATTSPRCARASALGFRGRRTTLRADYGGQLRLLSQPDRAEHAGTTAAALDFTHQLTRRVAAVRPRPGDVLADDRRRHRPGRDRAAPADDAHERFPRRLRGDAGAPHHASTRPTRRSGLTSSVDEARPARPALTCCRAATRTAASATLRHRSQPAASRSAPTTRCSAPSSPAGRDLRRAERAGRDRDRAGARHVEPPSATATPGSHRRRLAATTGPPFNLGLDWHGRRAVGTVGYARAFLPSFGFGGTFQNEELTRHVDVPFGRWLHLGAAASPPPTTTRSTEGNPTCVRSPSSTSLAVTVKRRLRLEAFVQHVSQDSGLAGGRVHRTRARHPGVGLTHGEGPVNDSQRRSGFRSAGGGSPPLLVARPAARRRRDGRRLPGAGCCHANTSPRRRSRSRRRAFPAISPSRRRRIVSERTRAISQELFSLPVIAQVAREEGLVRTAPTTRTSSPASAPGRQCRCRPRRWSPAGSSPTPSSSPTPAPPRDEAQRVTNRLLKVFIDRDAATAADARQGDRGASSASSCATASGGWTRSRRACARLKEIEHRPPARAGPGQPAGDERHPPAQRSTTPTALRDERDRLAIVEQQIDAARREVASDTRSDDEVKAQDRVATLEHQLADAQRSYTRSHPEIQRLQASCSWRAIEQAAGQDPAPRPPGARRRRPNRRVAQLTAERDGCGRGSASCRPSRAGCRRSSPPTSRASTRRRSSSSSWHRSSRPTRSRRPSTSVSPSAIRRR